VKQEQVGLDFRRYFRFVQLSFTNKFKLNYNYVLYIRNVFKTMLLIKMHTFYTILMMTFESKIYLD